MGVFLFRKEKKMAQTTIQNANTIQFGSGKFEYSLDGGIYWTDLGAMRNIVFTESWDEVEVPSDNAGIVKQGIKNQIATIAGDLMELDIEKLSELRGGIDSFSEIIGTSKTLKSGGKSTQTPIQAKVTNKDENADIMRITLFKVSSIKGIEITLNPDEADDPNMIPIELKGVKDISLDPGEQLFEIYSEQGAGAIS